MKNKIFFITGNSGSGKTTFFENLIPELKKHNLVVAGFKAQGYWQDNIRTHFDLVDMISGEGILFCTRHHIKDWEKVGHFYINPFAIPFGEKILDPKQLNQISLIAIDEIGPFELQGNGWFNAIMRITKFSTDMPMIWVVRKKLLSTVIDYFNVLHFEFISTDLNNITYWVEKIIAAVKSK
jgi:nucleoside-triphosphatase